jgi:hypothetical protein
MRSRRPIWYVYLIFHTKIVLDDDCRASTLTSIVSSTVLQNEICKGVPVPSRSAEIIRDVIIICAFTYVIVALRFYSRALVTTKLWWDDWAIALAAVSLEHSVIMEVRLLTMPISFS